MEVESNKKGNTILEIKHIVVTLIIIIDWQHKIKSHFIMVALINLKTVSLPLEHTTCNIHSYNM